MKKEYIIDRTSSVTLNVTAGKIDSFRKQEETTSTVRVYRDGKIGIAGVLGEGDEAALTEKAEAALSLGIPSASFGMYRGGGAHTREEWIEPSSLCGGMKAAASVLMNWFS